MINKLPRWIETGGFLLTFTAGSVNAIALLGFNHQGVSHLSGISTNLGVELGNLQLPEALHSLLIIASFVIGAAASGFVIGGVSLKLGRRYSITLLSESLLLVAAAIFLNRGSNLGHYLAAAACGLQNAMTSTYSGAIVRTTHLTGMFTDIGITVGLWFRGQPADKRRITLYAILASGFISGGAFGAICFEHFKFFSLVAPAIMAALIAFTYLYYWHRKKHSSQVR